MQADVMVCRVNSRTAKTMQRNPVLKITPPHTTHFLFSEALFSMDVLYGVLWSHGSPFSLDLFLL